MWFLRCCFSGEVVHRPVGCQSENGGADKAPCSCAANGTMDMEPALCEDAFVDPVPEGSRRCDVGDEGATSGVCSLLDYNGAITVDTAPVDTSCLPPPSRWSDFGSRPELEALFAPSPFLSINFSKQVFQPESLHLDSINSIGGYSSGLLGMFPAGRQPQGARDLRCSTFAQLVGAVSSTSWVGQGAQGAVVKAQWRSGGCTVAVKWLVTDAINVPAAYMEALLAKMLAHPFLVQTFDYAMCQLDDTFHQVNVCSDRLSRPKTAVGSETARGAADPQHATKAEQEQLSVATALDSFEGSQAERLGPRPVDCVEVLKELGAAPGKYVVQIVSEWCDEGTLHAAIRKGVFRPQGKRTRTWALRALLRTAREIAQGMCHLHSLNIIHGDLKPGNVLLKSSGADSRGFVAKVADFGLSRLCGQHEEYVATDDWGTVPYMAGEYLDNKLCKSSDVYSFGVLLWQMYTGKAPFAGHHEAQVAVGVMLGNLQLEWPTNMPPPLLRLGQTCCRHEQDQRPTFKECVVALDGIEVQIRELAANVKARYAALATQHGAASQGPNTSPAAAYAAAGAMSSFAQTRCSSLERPVVPGTPQDTPQQSFTNGSFFLPSGAGSAAFSTVVRAEGVAPHSQSQPNAAGLAAMNAFVTTALAALPDGSVGGNLTGASGYSVAEPAAASHEGMVHASATSCWSSQCSQASPAAAVGAAVKELCAAGVELWFPGTAGGPRGPPCHGLVRAGGGRSPWPSAGGADGANNCSDHCALFVSHAGDGPVCPGAPGLLGQGVAAGGSGKPSLRLWSSAGPCVERDEPPRLLADSAAAHAALYSPLPTDSGASSSCGAGRAAGAQVLFRTRTSPGPGMGGGGRRGSRSGLLYGTPSSRSDGNGYGLQSPPLCGFGGGEPGFGHRMASGHGNLSPNAWSHLPSMTSPTKLRRAGSRRGSVGPLLQHVPEDDGDGGSGFASEVDLPLAAAVAAQQEERRHQNPARR